MPTFTTSAPSNRRRQIDKVLALLIWLVLPVLTPRPLEAEMPLTLVVVVAADSPIRNVSSEELRRLYMRAGDAISGREMTPFNHPPGTDTRVAFDELALRMGESEAGRYWIDRRVRGQESSPRVVTPASLLRKVVAKFPNSIGYLRSNELDSSVRAVTIDGVPYDRAGYPLTRQ